VLSYQASAGSFGLWGPGSGDLWLDAYVTDFLTRAREQQFDVPETAMILALDNLQNALSYDVDIASQGNQIAYALYVLARNRRASATDLRYYSESQLDNFGSPMAAHILARRWRSMATSPRLTRLLRRRSRWRNRANQPTFRAATTARRCAMMRRCWHWRQRPVRCHNRFRR
jgi:uncharacterized protein YfaS (alpha-2-macroglobulin family)